MTPRRLRIRFSKHGKVRFTSHRDTARIWERALRRSSVPVAYSQGFNPRPRISFGLALSTGFSSDAEYLDVTLDPERSAELCLSSMAGLLTEALPFGITALAVAWLDAGEASLQDAVTSCTWRIDAGGADARSASRRLDDALACRELIVERERKGRPVREDIRPLVLAADVEGDTSDGVRLNAELGTQPRAARPDDLLASLDPPLRVLRVCRLHQWITTDSGRHEPLAGVAPSVLAAGTTL